MCNRELFKEQRCTCLAVGRVGATRPNGNDRSQRRLTPAPSPGRRGEQAKGIRSVSEQRHKEGIVTAKPKAKAKANGKKQRHCRAG